MDYQPVPPDICRPQDVVKEGVLVGSTELDGIAGVLWDARGTQAIVPRDYDVIYRLYRQEDASAGAGTVAPLRGRCFISEPQQPYQVGDTLMLETRDGQRFFGTVQQIREMRTGSLSLILSINE